MKKKNQFYIGASFFGVVVCGMVIFFSFAIGVITLFTKPVERDAKFKSEGVYLDVEIMKKTVNRRRTGTSHTDYYIFDLELNSGDKEEQWYRYYTSHSVYGMFEEGDVLGAYELDGDILLDLIDPAEVRNPVKPFLVSFISLMIMIGLIKFLKSESKKESKG